jgi:hypothetical protein
MKIYIPAAALLALSACGSTPPQNDMANNVQEVTANNMIADDVTEVQDDSAAAPTSSDVDARDAETRDAANRESESSRVEGAGAANAN